MRTTFIAILLFSISYFNVTAFNLITENSLSVNVDKSEESVVHNTLKMFQEDYKMVSRQNMLFDNSLNDNSVVVSTLDTNPIIKDLINSNTISLSKLENEWEAFQIKVVNYQNKNILVVVGSDKRGTSYGILELSRLIGVSPWVWWADSTPIEKSYLKLPKNYSDFQKPSVKYRGIFINDEDLGFMPWSTMTVDKAKSKGATGPIAYEKVYQLLLRLRANIMWPAMHECTVPFYQMEGNKEMADQYGIVIGTSHTEPLMTNSATEWDVKVRGDYDFVTNRDGLISYWEDRVEEAGSFENYYTLGIRGLHDVGMVGKYSLDDRTNILKSVIDAQRDILDKYVEEDVENIPQVFVPYKEVLPIYENGLEIPEDVSLMWCDDNYGYITRYSNIEEQKRAGGGGIYYHLSYLGRPHQYIWLSGTQPAMVYWQMKKAWDYGAQRVWIVNVGDIKPAEFDLEFYLDMAWNINSINENNIYEYQEKWLEREFGKDFSKELSELRNEYYRLSHIRRPEYMGWSRQEVSGYRRGRTPVVDTEFNPFAFNDEINRRLEEYISLDDRSGEIFREIDNIKKDAYYQLIHFPIKASSEMNKKLLYAQKARLYAKHNLPVANEYAEKSRDAYRTILDEVKYYNNTLSNGKWNRMMWHRAWGAPVYNEAPLPDEVEVESNDELILWPENSSEPLIDVNEVSILPLMKRVYEKSFISLFSKNGKKIEWSIVEKPKWIDVVEEELGLNGEKRLWFVLNNKQNKSSEEICHLLINNRDVKVKISTQKLRKRYAVEHDKLVVINSSAFKAKGEKPISIQGLGYSMNAIELPKGKSNYVEYKIYTESKGEVDLRACFLPNHPIDAKDIRYAVAINGEEPIEVSILSDFKNRDEEWKVNVLRNQAVKTTTHHIEKAGVQTVRVYALDEGIVLDQISLDFKENREYYNVSF